MSGGDGGLGVNDVVRALGGASGTLVDAASGLTLRAADLELAARSVARGLHGAGVGPGDAVAFTAPDAFTALVRDLACLRIGAIAVALPSLPPTTSLAELTERLGVAALLTAPERVPAEGLPPDGPAPHAFAPDELHALKFTSGSTGEPRVIGARAVHFDHFTSFLAREFGDVFVPGETLLVLNPISAYVNRVFAYLGLATGMTVVVDRLERVAAAAAAHRPAIVVTVPGALRAMAQLRERRGDALADLWGGQLRCIWTGGAPSDPLLLERYESAGIPTYEGYGLIETGLIARNTPAAHRIGTVGRPLPDVEVRFCDDGELHVRTGHAADREYRLGFSRSVFRDDGWMATGDVCTLDSDGYLTVVGRIDDVVPLANGRKVAVVPLEQCIARSPLIDECVLFASPRGSLVAAVVAQRRPVTVGDVKSEIAGRLAAGGHGERVADAVLCDPFTFDTGLRTATGKIRRAAVAERYGAVVA